MDKYTISEESYKNGYAKGYEDGKRDAVKHGRWENITGNMVKLGDCSNCKTRQIVGGPLYRVKYCRECGATMDAEKEAKP